MGDYDKKPVQTKAAPTAGPSEDDRYGAGKVGTNLSARIIKVDIVEGRTRITIAQGTTHGARTGMEGYIKSADGALARFQILHAKEAVSYADVDVTPDQLRNTPTVVINPTSHNEPRVPKIKEGESSRVIGVNIVEGKTRITIARGSLHGVTRGMRGTLQGNLGNEGDTFTIESASDRVSYAFVTGTVDEVQARPFVVFHPNASPSRPVQRRASGASTSTSDVQSTAEAGVAGASSRLPFFDQIQRSFGKHDISGVQAQVGGAATEASQALGAQAYATGNRVAFASAPDLHTAAHEAAHTIQQARGAVGFQGLGAADDEHERHADAVADAVVSGQSAEPLLDQLAGGGNAGAVQRKEQGKPIPHYDHGTRPHKLDTTVAAALLLRRISDITEIESQAKGADRRARVLVAVTNTTALLKELTEVAELEKPRWSEVTLELAHALRGVARLRAESLAPTDKRALDRAVLATHELIDRRTFEAAAAQHGRADVLPELQTADHAELAAQALIAACRRCALFKTLKEGSDEAKVFELMVEVQQHFSVAASTAELVPDLPLRASLRKDMELASSGMTDAQQIVKLRELPWSPRLAAAFDAENACRKAVGLTPVERPYSGTTDPRQAQSMVKEVADGGSAGDWTSKSFETPQQAVGGITLAMDEIFKNQIVAVTNATKHLKEPPPPASPSVLSMLLEIAIKTALAGAAGMLASFIGRMAGPRIESALIKRKIGDGYAIGLLPAADRAAIQKDLVKGTEVARALGVAAATDATKEFFKVGLFKVIEAALLKKPHKTPSSDPMQIFQEHSVFFLNDAGIEARAMLVHLAPALVQAELGSLNELYRFLIKDAVPRAYDVQYQKVMEEWQNLKAKAHAGGTKTADGKSSRDADVQEEAVNGALDITVDLGTDNYPLEPALRSMVLTGGEPAARNHFRMLDAPLSDVGLNQHYKLRFTTYMNYEDVHVGVGPDQGLHRESINDRDLSVLRVVAAQKKIQTTNHLLAIRGEDPEFARFSKSDLYREAEKIIRAIQKQFKTRHLR